MFFEEKLIGWTAALSHTTETGAKEPGGMPVSATSRFEEGMNLPPMKIGQDFRINNDIIELFRAFGIAPKPTSRSTSKRVARRPTACACASSRCAGAKVSIS